MHGGALRLDDDGGHATLVGTASRDYGYVRDDQRPGTVYRLTNVMDLVEDKQRARTRWLATVNI